MAGRSIEAKLRLAADFADALAKLRELRKEQREANAEGARPTPAGRGAGGTEAAKRSSEDQAAARAAAQADREKAQAARESAQQARAAARERAETDRLAERAARQRSQAERQAARDSATAEHEAARAGVAATNERRRGYQTLMGTIGQVRTLILSVAGVTFGVAAVRELAGVADGYTSLSARLRLVTKDKREYQAALRDVNDLSTRYQVPLNAVGTLYTRLAAAIQPLGGNLDQARQLADALLASFRKTGATAQEAASAALQFSQAIGSGVLQGEEFRALAEAAPAFLDALAKGLGKPRAELKKLGEEGKLTTAEIVRALPAMRDLAREAEQVPGTIGGAATEVSNAFTRLVGQTAEGSKGVQTIVGALKLLAENLGSVIKWLAILGSVLGALKLGAFVSALASTVAGLGLAAGATGALTVALKGMLALIGGPIGLIVALGSLALAWLGVREAQKKAAVSTEAGLREQRDEVAKELKKLQEESRSDQFRTANLGKIGDAQRRLAALDQELAERRRLSREDARQDDGVTTGGGALRDNRKLADLRKEFKTRQDVVRDFAEKRASLELELDRRIADARSTGNREAEQQLLAERRERLGIVFREERDALRAFDKESVADRVKQVRDVFDQRIELTRDALEREAKLNEQAFEEGIRSAAEFLTRRSQLEAQQADEDVAALEKRLDATRAALLENQGRLALPGLGANAKETLNEAVVQQSEQVARLEADITKRKRDQVDAQRELGRLTEQYAGELRRTLAELDSQIKQADGTESIGDIQARVQAQFQQLRERVFQLGGDIDLVDALVGATTRREAFRKLQEDFAVVVDALRLKEEELQRQVDHGALTTVEAERRKFEARAAALPQLRQLLEVMQTLAKTDAERNAIKSLVLQIDELADTTTELQRTLRGAAQSGLAQLFTDIVTGAEDADKAIGNFARSFLRTMLDLLNKRLAEQLVNSALDALKGLARQESSGGSGWIGAIAKFFVDSYHSGGIVGQAFSAARAVAPWVFHGAQVLHSGGIAGLMSDEQPAILRKGEEVLTQDDPRHVRNLGAGNGGRGGPVIGNLSISVSTDGTGSGAGDAAMARELSSGLRALVQQYIVDQMRPGGVLQNVRP